MKHTKTYPYFTVLFLLFTLIVLPRNVSAVLNQDHDWQLWTMGILTKEVNKNAKVVLSDHTRWGDNMSKVWYNHLELEYRITQRKDFQMGLALRETRFYIPDRYGVKKWVWAHEPVAIFHFHNEFKDWKIYQRHRLQCRTFDNSDYKNRFFWRYFLVFNSPWKWTCLDINPYTANEWWLDGERGYVLNRLYGGISYKLIGDLKGQLYYMLESGKTKTGWRNFNVLGVNLSIAW